MYRTGQNELYTTILGRGGYRRGAEGMGDRWIIDGHGSEENENEHLLSTSRRELRGEAILFGECERGERRKKAYEA